VMIENRSHFLLRDITVRITKGSTPTSYGFVYQKKGIRFIKTENIDSKGLASTISDYIDEETHQFLKRSILEADDVLFSIAGTIGRIGIVRAVDLPANTNQALAIIRPQAEVIDPKYLFHFLNSPIIQQQTKKKTAGVGRANVSLADVGEFEIWLPRTIEEQKRIVAEIEKQFSRLDEAVASLKRIQANLKRYKAAVLKAAVEGKLTEQWRKDHSDVEPAEQLLKRILAERRAKWEAEELAKMKGKGIKPKDDSWKKKYKEPAGPDTANLPELPEGWVWAKSDQLFSFVTSGSRGWASYYSETGPIFLRMGNLDHDTIQLDLTDIQRVQPPNGAEGLRTRVAAGDILVSITADVGMVGIVPEEFEDAFINQHVSLARPLLAVNSTFIAWFLACKSGQDQFKELQRGATKVGLGLDDIKSVNVPLPPVEEQMAILAEIDRRFSVTEELESTIETNLKRAERLRQSVLSKAFSSEIEDAYSEV